MEWQTLQAYDLDQIREYASSEDALVESVRLNQKDQRHPRFYLYHWGKSVAILTRKFGTNTFFWDYEEERCTTDADA